MLTKGDYKVKKILFFAFVTLFVVVFSPNESSAACVIPEDEVILDSRELDDQSMDVFTQRDDKYYRVVLNKRFGFWAVSGREEIEFKNTGLKNPTVEPQPNQIDILTREIICSDESKRNKMLTYTQQFSSIPALMLPFIVGLGNYK